jgi:NTE family protein
VGDTVPMTTGLVLGGGGIVGLAYHTGVLRALAKESAFDPAGADLIVGTSAGAAIGAYLRTGWTIDDFWEMAHGRHPVTLHGAEEDRPPLVPAFGSPVELVRRGLGAAYVLTRSVVRFPILPVPSVLQSAFPGHLFDSDTVRERLFSELPDEWPDRDLWLTSVDIASGRRVVLGRPGAPQTTLPRAVLASCAIPGVYSPVKVGRRTLVDGGAHSSTNLDLAVKAGCDLVVGIAPMAYDPANAPHPVGQLVRRIPARSLAAEVRMARGRGARVLLLRPDRSDVRSHGLNFMRSTGLGEVAQAAYDSTARALATDRFAELVASA